MGQRLGIVGLVIVAAIAIFAFVQQQQSATQLNVALTAQSGAEGERDSAVTQAADAATSQADLAVAQSTSIALAQTAQTAQAVNEAAQATAESQAGATQNARETAESHQATAEAQAANAQTAQANAESAQATAISGVQAVQTLQAAAENALATAAARADANSTTQFVAVAAQATVTANLQYVTTRQAAAESDLATAQAQASDLQVAQLDAQFLQSTAVAQANLAATRQVNAVMAVTLAAGGALNFQATQTAAPTLTPTILPTEGAAVVASPTAPFSPILPTPSEAAELGPLTETFTSSDGRITLLYPQDWNAEENQGQILITNYDTSIAANGIQSGEIAATLLVLPSTLMTNNTVSTVTSSIGDFLAQQLAGSGTTVRFSEPIERTINGHQGATTLAATRNYDVVAVTLIWDTNDVIVMFGLTAAGEGQKAQEIFITLLENLEFRP